MTRWTRGMAAAVALGSVTLLGACNKSENAADTTMTGMMSDSAMNHPGMSNMASTAQTMTDAQILAMVTAANEGEIAAGKLASTKATNDSVRAFARDMVTDHSKMLDDGRALAQKLNITPASAAADSLTRTNQDLATQLSSAARGAAFDTMYVNAQVAGHQQVLDMIKNAEGQAQSADLKKSMLQSAQGTVQQHLDRIRAIQGRMS